MILTYSLNDTGDLKQRCFDLINRNTSFSVRLVRDDNGEPHHWEIEE